MDNKLRIILGGRVSNSSSKRVEELQGAGSEGRARARGVSGSREAWNLGYYPAALPRPASSGNPYKASTWSFTEFFDVLTSFYV